MAAKDSAIGMMRAVRPLAILVLLFLVACGPGAEVTRGRDLYLAYGCAACHGENADGNGPAAGLAHIPPRDLTNLKGYRGASTIEGISSTIAFGVAEGRTGMPAYPDIPQRERTAIAEYLHSLAQESDGAPRVRAAWVRALLPAQDTTAGYLMIENPGAKPLALVSVTSPDVRVIELHVMQTKDGMMTMQHVQKIDVPPREFIRFEPGGAHLMLIGFKPRNEIDLRLVFDDGSVVNAKAPVRDVE
ncbi:MAG TPA: copper chaperone PCu(A)C [Thermoanaerobaculia bacterium]